MDEAKPKAYKTGPMSGGELPDVGKLFNETMAEFTENIGPYALAGVGQMLVVFPLTFVSIIVLYVVMGLGFFAGTILTSILGGIVANLSEELAGIVMSIGMILTMMLPFALMFVVIAGIIALIAPMQASLYRAVAAQQRGEKKLELTSPFSTMTQGLVPVMMASFLLGMIATVALMFCYVPILLVPVFFGFTTLFAALHGMGGLQSARTSFQHAVAHLGWYVMFGLLSFLLGMFASYIPVVGPMFAVSFHVRAYRYLFGDGPEPTLA